MTSFAQGQINTTKMKDRKINTTDLPLFPPPSLKSNSLS